MTAAGQGIGRAIAERFAAEGAKLIATDLDPNKLQGLRGKLRKLDVLTPDDIEAFSRDIGREYGALDVLVNCAGYVHQGSVLDCSDKDWDFSFNLNVKSMHHMIKTFLPGMLQKKAGSIVNISSTVSSIRGVPNRYAYGATKAAVIGLTKAVAADFIKQGIRCNAVCPGTIELPSLGERISAVSHDSGRSLDQVRQDFVARQPMGRLGTPEEVAWLTLFLASDELSYITGQAHLVDGGMALCSDVRRHRVTVRMHILMTGAAGMIGRKLTARLIANKKLNGKPIERLTLLDVTAPGVRRIFPLTLRHSRPTLPIRRPLARPWRAGLT